MEVIFLGIVLLVVSAVFTLAAVPPARKLAEKLDAIDYPSGRRVNKAPIPRLGGVAMFSGMMMALCFLMFLVQIEVVPSPLISHPVLQVDYTWTAVGVTLMFAVGVVDDVYDLHPRMKLLGQIAAASIVACSGVVFTSVHNPLGGWIHFGIWGYPLAVVYLVCFANVINLIDGLDGLAAGITAITAGTLLVFSIMTSRSDAAMFCFVLIGACLGFLRYNRHPASIFMGDSGSLTLGFFLGIISLFAIARAAIFTSLLVPIVAAGVPIADTVAAIIRRKRGHKPIDQADRGHIHHRLLDSGHSHAETVHLMWMWTALLSLSSIAITQLEGWSRIILFIALGGISWTAIHKLHLLRPVLEHKYNPRFSRRHVRDGTFSNDGTLISPVDGGDAEHGDGSVGGAPSDAEPESRREDDACDSDSSP